MRVAESGLKKAKEKNRFKNTVVQMHATWLAVNSVIGCTNGCKYCFLQSTNKNISKPLYLKNSKMAIDDLMNSKYYLEDIPENKYDTIQEIIREKQLLQLEYGQESNKKEIIEDITR